MYNIIEAISVRAHPGPLPFVGVPIKASKLASTEKKKRYKPTLTVDLSMKLILIDITYAVTLRVQLTIRIRQDYM